MNFQKHNKHHACNPLRVIPNSTRLRSQQLSNLYLNKRIFKSNSNLNYTTIQQSIPTTTNATFFHQMAWSALITLALLVAYAHGHGRLNDPPNRASLWRFGYNVRPNYDDDGLNCGGFSHQWMVNGGRWAKIFFFYSVIDKHLNNNILGQLTHGHLIPN